MSANKYTKCKAGKSINGVFPVLAWDGSEWEEVGTMTAIKDRPRGVYYPEAVVEYEIEMNDGEFFVEAAWGRYNYKPAQTSHQAKRSALAWALEHANTSFLRK